MKHIKVLGIDLAKSVFQLHGNNQKGECVLKKRLSRAELIEFMSNLQPCTVGMEACIGAHYWARTFEAMGHTVKIIAPKFVRPFVMNNKNDANDAQGIAEAITRPHMRFVAAKSIRQQDVLLMHRAREQAMKQKIQQSNQIRALLLEYGVVIPKGVSRVSRLVEILEKNKDKLTAIATDIFKEMHEIFKQLEKRVDAYEKQIKRYSRENALCKEIMKIKGVGPITASAIIATIGDAMVFKNGRQLAAWLGLTPRQHSSGNMIRLGGISKRGDSYVRKLLVHGGRSAIQAFQKKRKKLASQLNEHEKWSLDKFDRIGYNKAAVALANKNARTIWAIMATGEVYREPVITAA